MDRRATEVGQWEIIEEGEISKAQMRAWELAEGSTGSFRLLANPGTSTGWIRLIQLNGSDHWQIRSNDQSWDPGGIFDLNMRVKDMSQVFPALQSRHWQASSDPVEFKFGPFHVSEWIVKGPDGVRLALIERLAPELEGWPHMQGFSRSFNATQIVDDLEESMAFFRDILGMKLYMEHEGASKTAGPNVLGLPHNLATEISRKVVILHPQGINEGSFELLEFEGLVGRDFSDQAWLPGTGIAALRVPCDNLAELAQHLDQQGYARQPIQHVRIVPYGASQTMLVTAPNGSRLEFFQTE